jgi:hypothetical protein
MYFRILILTVLLSSILISCGVKKQSLANLDRPQIYDAWDARYIYQMENRRMIPVYEGRMVGRSWGRDESGKINHVSYLGPDKKQDEDLLSFHQYQSDRKREKKWKEAKEQRIEFIQSRLDELEEDENAPLIEIELEEEDDFVPPVFIPQGIDFSAPEAPTEDAPVQGDGLPLPFAPL